METMIRLKGVLKKPIFERIHGGWFRNWLFWPEFRRITFKAQKMTLKHTTDQELRTVINALMQDVQKTQSLIIVADETKSQADPSNLQLWPLDNFLYIAIETKQLTVPVPTYGKGSVN